jgi:hypothetical protein
MVDHHTVSPDLDPKQLRKVDHSVHEKLLVRVIPEDGQPGVTSADDVVAGVGKLKPERAWHGGASFFWTPIPYAGLPLKSN